MEFLLTGDPGLEDLVAGELTESWPDSRARERPFGFAGQLLVEAAGADGLLELSTVHHVLEILERREVETLDDVRAVVERTLVPALDGAGTFRVTTERLGRHPFNHVDVQRAAGGVLHRRYGVPVDLEQAEVDVRVDLYGSQLVVGVPCTERSLGKRLLRARALRSALKPTIAAALVRLAGAHRGAGRLLDPLCGAGTIPIEARRINPALEVLAADWDGETVEVARQTIANHELPIPVACHDARAPYPEAWGHFDYIITDPPYGVRQARHTSVGRLYRGLLPQFEAALKPGGTLILVVVKKRTCLAAVERTGLQLTHERQIEAGGLRPWILLFRRAQ